MVSLFILTLLNQYKTPLSYCWGMRYASPDESGIEERPEVDVLPFIAGINGSVRDNYAKSIWPAGLNCYVDCRDWFKRLRQSEERGWHFITRKLLGVVQLCFALAN